MGIEILYVFWFASIIMVGGYIVWIKKTSCKQSIVNERKVCEERIKFDSDIIYKLAFEDELTGLYNRRKFLIEGNDLLQSSHLAHQYALLSINIDKFTFIRSIYGYHTGNEILIKTAQIIQELTAKNGICGRRDDAGFAILFQIQEVGDISLLYESLAARISKIKIKENINYGLQILVGAAIYPTHGSRMSELYENVKFVEDQMRKNGNKTFQIFDNELKETILRQQVIAMELQEAIKNKEFILNYQPKIDTLSQKIVGMEALIRWKHPKKGFISPNEFIPIAEQAGLITEIGKWGLMEACLQNKAWQDKGYEKYIVSVNISAIEFYQEDMLDSIKETLKTSGLEAQYLEIELTESMTIIDKKQTIAKMKAIRALGVKIALDDFGTGYSSLSYLKVLPIDVLKLDQSFIVEIERDHVSKCITLSIIDLSRLLNIETVAEGVETKEQAELLSAMGCNMIQGYYYSKPIEADLFEERYMKIV
ncbi:putative bifunctional diguanylate cyclase/phosphodiesterase [Cellulosilyticum sp. I15G10I2]|uniref:putative bifunctional diguanylate cyclase/phosphodiesterase n=1 Tax=Cellulosilyticum sp. I15G10I2 TaxID=1892843 RepID=UPI00085BFCC5|nr:bifunctional diguanylate cyclase/phosphodiesterase [Cellulosilyticum sp. I15G10I2]